MAFRAHAAGLVTALVLLAACGGSSPSRPTVTPTPVPTPPPAPAVIYQNSGSVPAETIIGVQFSAPGPGTVSATVDWTFASSEVFTALSTDGCPFEEASIERVFLGNCSNVGLPVTSEAKPKVNTGSVSAAGVLRLWIANLSEADESMSIQVVHTRTTAAGNKVTTLLAPTGRWQSARVGALR